jgi:threonine aldolase
MQFASDNTGPVHPRILQALVAANEGHAPSYGADALTDRVTAQVREILEVSEATVCLVTTGTAANALLLSSLSHPWDTIFCTDVAHIHEDECNAPEFFTGGAKLTLVPAEDGRMTAAALRDRIVAEGNRGIHGPQRGPISLTQATECGTVHSLRDLQAIAEVAGPFGLPVHMDGARFANAVAGLGCTPAQMMRQAGLSALSLGGTKNGLMGAEAAVLLDPEKARELELRRKRAGHLMSKHRFLAAQMSAYLEDGLWLEMAASANAACHALAEGLRSIPGVRILYPPDANIIFAAWPRAMHRRLLTAGAVYSLSGDPESGPPDEMLTARLVCDWSTTPDASRAFLDFLAAG